MGSSHQAIQGKSVWLGLVGFLVLCLLVAALGGWWTATSVNTWYVGIAKPEITPPSWVFGPVWTVLYILMAVAGWRVWKTYGLAEASAALGLFFTQLFLNLMWSGLFFGLREVGWAFFELVFLWALVLGTMLQFWRKDTWAGILFIPYFLWVTFAGYLNLRIWLLN